MCHQSVSYSCRGVSVVKEPEEVNVDGRIKVRKSRVKEKQKSKKITLSYIYFTLFIRDRESQSKFRVSVRPSNKFDGTKLSTSFALSLSTVLKGVSCSNSSTDSVLNLHSRPRVRSRREGVLSTLVV